MNTYKKIIRDLYRISLEKSLAVDKIIEDMEKCFECPFREQYRDIDDSRLIRCPKTIYYSLLYTDWCNWRIQIRQYSTLAAIGVRSAMETPNHRQLDACRQYYLNYLYIVVAGVDDDVVAAISLTWQNSIVAVAVNYNCDIVSNRSANIEH